MTDQEKCPKVLVPRKETASVHYQKYDGDVVALRGLCNSQGIVLPSRQPEVWASIGRVLDQLAQAKAEIERLAAIVDKLPRTGDGVVAVPGLDVFDSNGLIGDYSMACMEPAVDYRVYWVTEEGQHIGDGDMSRWYSTRDAAEAAKGK